MPYRITPFVNEQFYHLYNRGLNKQQTFSNTRDYNRFIKTLFYYQIANPKPRFSFYKPGGLYPIDPTKKIVDIVAYCLMPNHFHLLVKQVQQGGISEFMRKFIHSYTKYRNTKSKIQGPVFQGLFKAVLIETDEQLIHVSRYIHLNPLVSYLVKDLKTYLWSSYPIYIGLNNDERVAKEEILSFFKSPEAYEQFVLDQADYGMTLEAIKHQLIDIDE
ncbi:MAG: transposase [Patescibacteria group bacterium]